MPNPGLSAAQICELAQEIAKCQGYTLQAGQFLNSVLADLAQTYDFDQCRGTFNFSFTGVSGPYSLPADWLRSDLNDTYYTISSVPYPMMGYTQQEYDWLVQTAGLNGFPQIYMVNLAPQGNDPAGVATMYVWPPPSGGYPVTTRYHKQMPDYTSPENSATVPWFPNQQYLITRLAGELCKITDDLRWQQFLSDKEDSGGAGDILRKYLKLANENSSVSRRVTLARQRFHRSWNALRNTKTIGWAVALLAGNLWQALEGLPWK